MTETEKKALALVNEVSGSGSWTLTSLSHPYNRLVFRSLCKAIEQHEAFRQEVSDLVADYVGYVPPDAPCHPIVGLIIAKPDPLVDAWMDAFPGNHIDDARDECAKISAALAARGLEVRKIGEGE